MKPKLALVVDGAVTKRNIQYGVPVKGVPCSFTKSTTLQTYKRHGIYHVQTVNATYDRDTQKRTGPVYEFDPDTEVVLRKYTLIDISEEDQESAADDAAMLAWEQEMQALDKDMPRWAEDLWDAVGIQNAPVYVQEKHAAKKVKRAEKPNEG